MPIFFLPMKIYTFLILFFLSCTAACAQTKTLTSKQNKILLQSLKASNANNHTAAIQQLAKINEKEVANNSSFHFFSNAVYYNYFSFSSNKHTGNALDALDKSLYHLAKCDSLESVYNLSTYTVDNRVRLEQTLNLVGSFANTLYNNTDFSSLARLSAILRARSSAIRNRSDKADASYHAINTVLLNAAIHNQSKADVLFYADAVGSKNSLSREERLYLCQIFQSYHEDKLTYSTALQGLQENPNDHQFVDIALDVFRGSQDKKLFDYLTKQVSTADGNPIHSLADACLCYHQQQYDKAYDILNTLLATYPDSPALYSMVAETCLKSAYMSELSGQSEDAKIRKALSLFLRLKEMYPDNRSEWVNGLYAIYFRLQMIDKLKELEPYM